MLDKFEFSFRTHDSNHKIPPLKMTLKPYKSILLAFVVCVILTFSGSLNSTQGAAPDDTSRLTLPEVVVTATRTETPNDKTASTVSVINREDIETNQYRGLLPALRTVPSLSIADRGTPGSVAGIFLRGTKSEHTAVLIDGRPIPANLAGTFNIETFSLDNIERVEVLSGPASSLYGGKAIGGVINLITRSGKGLEKPENSIILEGGSNVTMREEFSSRGSSGILDYSVDASYFQTDGERINSAYNLTNASGHFGAQVSSNVYLETDVRFYDSSLGVPGPAFGFGANDPNDHLDTRLWSVSPGIIWQVNDSWKQSLTYTFSRFQQEATGFNYFGDNNTAKIDEHFINYQNDIHVTDAWQVTVGGTYENRSFSRFNNDVQITDVDSSENNWSLFLQSQIELFEGFNIVGGVRYDDYSLFGDATTWRVGVSYRIPHIKTLVHANIGTAFSPPSPQDVQPALYGNPLLAEPERSLGWEAGLEQPFWGDKAVISATYFRNDITDLIEFDPTLFVLTQVGQARMEGVELGFKLSPVKQLQLVANYTYLDAENLTDGVRLVRRPRSLLNASATWSPTERLRLGLACSYVADREDGFGVDQHRIEDYVNLRLTASVKLTKQCQLFGRVENLIGNHYQEVLGYPANGRVFIAGLQVGF